ncbi:response regulator transcription factor [Deinococcus sp. Arct2-2]|uniref:response regulator transcription factor n=1 Tax=Deinococcus sp. Arct2-2 TaxID=2568653 RepID=UPI0010A3ACC2|nr:response regulator transcription factor [Deinococcus sp. Arct2-2]THF68538.1 response regulator transcription factor [Deinococcus sp. Arct2-2]
MTTWPVELAIEPGSARHVLVIEDNIHDALLLETALEEVAAEIQVTRVIGGPAALRVFETFSLPQLVVLDLHLPGEQSGDILQALRT